MPKYQMVAGTYTQITSGQTKVFVAGTSNNVVELTEITAKRLGPTFVPVNELESEEAKGVAASFDPYEEFLSYSSKEIEQALPSMHDPVVLAEIHAMESQKGSKSRHEVLEAIDERYDELQEEHSKA